MSQPKTRVLLLIPSLVFRGAERMLVNLVNHLNQDRFSIHVVSLSRDNPLADHIRSGAVTFTALPRVWRYDIGPARELQRIIVNQRIDTIIAFDIFSFFYIWLALRGTQSRPKIFISIHNIRFRSYRHWLQSVIYARLLTGKELFLSVCNAQTDYWAKTYLIPKERFITVYNGVDTLSFSPSIDVKQKKLIRSRLEISEDTFIILQVASLVPEKRHEDSLLALKYLTREIAKPILLVFVGDGAEKRKKRLKQLAQAAGVMEQVRFCGIQSDVRPFYEIADLFTLTSETETFSMAALEAMSMGLPCVLTDVGGAREMIVEGMNGYLVRAKTPRHIAIGWAAAYKNKDQFDHQKIRARVIQIFSLSECTRTYENLLTNFSSD